jgi:class 3 adenylate cyclase/predicted ATPase
MTGNAVTSAVTRCAAYTVPACLARYPNEHSIVADDIGRWLKQLGLERYAALFAANEIEIEALPHLSEADLEKLGLPLGPRKTLLAAIAALKPATTPPPPRVRPDNAEHRQLTVMFVDLVGSTALSTRLDVEDLRELINRYQNVVATEVARYEGHIARFLGDGVLVYFGYPIAYEDSAERAVQCALDIAGAVGRVLVAGERMEVRIGVATGQVVIGDLVGEGSAQEEAVIGETPNLAARLQQVAAPGSIAIAPATRALLGTAFEVDGLGSLRLKGFPEPVTCWRVIGKRAVETRFEARGTNVGRVVGRDQEMALLAERWARAQEGEGQIVLLTGQAGIGKSRLTHALTQRLTGTAYTRLTYQCSPYHVHSALHPFIAQLERAAGFAPADPVQVKGAKLDALLRRATENVSESLSLIGALLSLPEREGAPLIEPDPKRRKQRTFDALLDQLTGLAAREPVLLIFEDAHWADPTSLELLEQTTRRLEEARVLAVVSGRPEFRPSWTDHPHVTHLTLSRLGRRHCAEIVASLAGAKALPPEVLDRVVDRTDGVPLFVEELTKVVLESGLLEETGDRFVMSGEIPMFAIPSTLQDSLMARLDRLAPMKEVAQIGAAIGREFSHRLLASVSPLTEDELTDALGELVRAELLFRRGTPPDAAYAFKHALVRDAAYGSLLRPKRRAIHERIATALVAEQSGSADTEPELLAHHYTEAGLAEQAIQWWQRAGRRAAERFADAEAREHLQRALNLLPALPVGGARDERELETRVLLGPVLMNLEATASATVGANYRRARELSERVGEPAQRFRVIWGLFSHLSHAGEFQSALPLVQEALVLAESLGNEEYLLQAHHAAWTCQAGLGDHYAVVTHAEQGLAIYDVGRHRAHAFTYGGHDPGMCAATCAAISLWLLGYPDRARDRSRDGLEIAASVAHPYSTAHALAYAGHLHLLLREPVRALAVADELISFCDAHGLSLWRANGQVVRSWALSEIGRGAEALETFRAAVRQRQAAGARVRLPLQFAGLAHALARAGTFAEAFEALESAEEVKRSGEQTWEAIIAWIRGQVYALMPQPDVAKVASCYERACALARRQSARSVELRAATSLAELWSQQGRKADAWALLAPIHAWFTEGFETPDLADAKALLARLA